MRPTRNWTTYVPESESALRKKCIELSPSFPLSTSTTKVSSATALTTPTPPPSAPSAPTAAVQATIATTPASLPVSLPAPANRFNQNNNINNNNHSNSNNNINSTNNNNNNQIKDYERNGMKNNLRKNTDCINKTTVAHFGDENKGIFQLTSAGTIATAPSSPPPPIATATATPPTIDTSLTTVFDKEFKHSATTANSIDLDADCEKSNSNLEHAPLIQLSPNKSITLVKQNSTSLIFTKKDVNPVVHRKRITLVRSTGAHSNSEITTTAPAAAAAATAPPLSSSSSTTTTTKVQTTPETDAAPIISHTDETVQSSKKRHSFHWHSDPHGSSASDKIKRKQIKSWYAVIGSPSVRESSFDSDTEESLWPYEFRNERNGDVTATTTEPWTKRTAGELKNVPFSYRSSGNCTTAAATATVASQEMGHHATTSGSKYNRFEQLLKNLVGRKVSREMPTIATSLSTSAIIGSNASIVNTVAAAQPNHTHTNSNNRTSIISNVTSNGSTKTAYSSNAARAIQQARTYSGDDLSSCASQRSDEYVDQQLNQPLLVTSPEIKISRTPSAHNLFRNEKCLMSTSSVSTTSLNATMQQRLWSVMPLLRRESSCASLNHSGGGCGGSSAACKPLIHQRSDVGLKKCETVSTLTHSQTTSNFEPIKPRNRLRQSPSVATCSRCSSILSLAANGSRYSLNIANGGFVPIQSNLEKSPSMRSDMNKADQVSLIRSSLTSLSSPTDGVACKLCLNDVKPDKMVKIHQCGCQFCIDCMKAYVEFEILEGAYEISCPDAMCPYQGIMDIEEDIAALASHDLMDKHKRFRLNREIELDKNRTWCPRAGCETVCLVEPKSKDKGIAGQSGSLMSLAPVAVKCPTCIEEFCSSCKKAWHPLVTCEENARRLAANGADDSIGIPFDTDLIKCCPMCGVPIEKDEGCAQMMCKRCKHVFCWYCLASLDDDFLLRHYDKGPCKNKLGHSRASVVWHRAQVIGIFASFGILLLVASPLLLLAAPCIVCCKCRACSTKLDDVDNDFDDPNNGTQNR